jgi:hypothetical protein
MKLTRSFVSLALSFSLVFVSFLSFSIQQVNAQDSKIALQRGYRTGYSDGYMSGYRDSIENAPRGYERHKDYTKGDRAYTKEYGALEDYRDGYQQGFEIGYDTGFDKRSFDAALPIEIKKRGTVPSRPTVKTKAVETRATETATTVVTEVQETNQPQPVETEQRNEIISYARTDDQSVTIPVDTELIIEILSDINTQKNKEGDKFQARVVSPAEISGAIIEGRISKIQKPGRIKRRAEMSLSFDQIRLSETRWANYSAILTEVLPIQGDNVKRVDTEGTVEGKSSIKSDSVKLGAATGTGLVVGAIAGGPVGAAVGAGVGAAFGVGAVVVERGKHVNLIKGQQLRIRTAYETQIR